MNEIEIAAKLVIDRDAIVGMLSGLNLESNYPPEPKKPRGWPKGKKRKKREPAPEPAPEPVQPPVVEPPTPTPPPTQAPPAEAPPVEQVRLKIDGKIPIEDQIKSAILQAAMHTHGDAIARKIMTNWDTDDTKSVATCRQIFPNVRLEAIAKATMDMQPAMLVKLPRLWLAALFDMANNLVARPVTVPVSEPVGCTICGNTTDHKAGCPMGLLEASRNGDGGAITAEMRRGGMTNPQPAPAPDQPEVCALDGPKGGCPLPHAMIFQGGAHIPVHPPEVMARIRQATTAQSMPAPVWDAPAPPAAEPPARKRGRPRKET